jgi:hypothetical protein
MAAGIGWAILRDVDYVTFLRASIVFRFLASPWIRKKSAESRDGSLPESSPREGWSFTFRALP